MSYGQVFDAYPDATEIWVIDGMPFLTEEEANSHKRFADPDAKVERVLRAGSTAIDAPGPTGGADHAGDADPTGDADPADDQGPTSDVDPSGDAAPTADAGPAEKPKGKKKP
jgi:hypothetical protein